MPARLLIRLAITLAATLAVFPASAQLYKWVDANGVTNYSNQPPADRAAVKNLRPVEDRLSVYSPDPGLANAIEDNRRNAGPRRAQRERIEALEYELDAERRARQQAEAAAARNAAYDRCVAEGRFDCDSAYGFEPYYIPAIGGYDKPRRRHGVHPAPRPGTIAGHVTADKGAIAGNVNAGKGKTAGTITGIEGTMPGYSGATPARSAPSRPSYDRR